MNGIDEMKKAHLDDLSEDKLSECVERATSSVETKPVPEINIPNMCRNQEYVCMSIIGTNARQKGDTAVIQILGCFPSLETGQEFAKEVGRKSPAFDIYVAPMYKWVPVNTRPEDAQSVEYCNSKVDELMKDYRMRQEMSNEIFEERRRLGQAQGIAEK